ncbi:MAG: 50S ribosomal protein L25 [Gemmatimonadetes bacterium]|nr:50S ribosomal protein L25 [Gemmatimonadota bacterium]
MATAALSAQTRAGTGKGNARSLRRQGQVPAVVYGKGREPESLALDAVTLERLLARVRAATTIIDITVGDREPFKALIREIQRNPVRPTDIIHVDLYQVRADEKVSVEVPLKFVGTAEGVRNSGGIFEILLHDLEILVLPTNIPDHLDVDVNDLGLGQSLHVSDLELPGIEILTDGTVTVCTVVAPKVEEPAPGAVAEAAAAPAEPELIRKAKPTDEEEAEKAEKK